MKTYKYQKYAPLVLRISISLVLLWFGINQVFGWYNLAGYVPPWAAQISPFSVSTILVLNGSLEIILGIALLVGFFTRIAAIIAALHIAFIGIALGYNDIMIRDISLAIAAFAIFLAGPDKWCWDKRK